MEWQNVSTKLLFVFYAIKMLKFIAKMKIMITFASESSPVGHRVA